MKKILIAQDIYALLEHDKSFLERTGFKVFVAALSDEALRIHRFERVNLIITQLDMPGMVTERFCSLIREDEDLRAVSMIMVCADSPEAIARSAECRANAVLLQPVHPLTLMITAQQLLDIAAREPVRVLLNASVDGRAVDKSFYCRVRNISATGMLIDTRKPLAKGALLSCKFSLPNTQKIEVPGKIVRSVEQSPGQDMHHYGLMFTDVAPETRQLLIAYVNNASRKSDQSGS
jgi:CheY-like chemotaxis protein